MEELIIRNKGKTTIRKYGFLKIRAISGGSGGVTPQEIRLVMINRYSSTIIHTKFKKMYEEIKIVIEKYFEFQQHNSSCPRTAYPKRRPKK